MDWLAEFTANGIEAMVLTFIFVIGLVVAGIIVLFFIDISQTQDAIRRNYPVIGRFRHLFSELGEFFRQYFFAMDREEMPFNRAEREWVYKSSRGVDNTLAFGSTINLNPPGSVIFMNCAFPIMDDEATPPPPVTFGPNTEHPYEAQSLINISGMSYGALSKPAVLALSKGAKLAGCWMNTGEGGLAPHHLTGGADIIYQIGTAKYGVRTLDGKLDDKSCRTWPRMSRSKCSS